jgi:hypothetical protein
MWPRLKILSHRITTMEYTPRYSRLAGELASYKPFLEKRIIDSAASASQWAIRAGDLIEESERFLKRNKIDEGWKSFHAAKRMEVFDMEDGERLAIAKSLFREAGKLNEWRKDSIINLLGTAKGGVVAAPSKDALLQALTLKDEAYDNQFYLNRLSHNLFWLLSGLLFIVITGIVIYFALIIGSMGSEYVTDLNLTGYIVGVLLFGLLGALTSAIVSTRQLSQSSRISELGSSQVITMSKIFIGAGFSIFIFLLLRSSVADSINLFSFRISKPLDYFAIAFASGFTERLAQKSIALLLGKESPENKAKADKPDKAEEPT